MRLGAEAGNHREVRYDQIHFALCNGICGKSKLIDVDPLTPSPTGQLWVAHLFNGALVGAGATKMSTKVGLRASHD